MYISTNLGHFFFFFCLEHVSAKIGAIKIAYLQCEKKSISKTTYGLFCDVGLSFPFKKSKSAADWKLKANSNLTQKINRLMIKNMMEWGRGDYEY
jgi:hypothetical protein